MQSMYALFFMNGLPAETHLVYVKRLPLLLWNAVKVFSLTVFSYYQTSLLTYVSLTFSQNALFLSTFFLLIPCILPCISHFLRNIPINQQPLQLPVLYLSPLSSLSLPFLSPSFFISSHNFTHFFWVKKLHFFIFFLMALLSFTCTFPIVY